MSVSLNSQVLLEKTVFKGQNAFIGNEVAMDSISETYIRFKATLSEKQQCILQLDISQKENEKLMLENESLKGDNKNLELQKKELTNQLGIKDKIHDNDINFWKEKAKGKFKSFLFGLGVGALVVAMLSLI